MFNAEQRSCVLLAWPSALAVPSSLITGSAAQQEANVEEDVILRRLMCAATRAQTDTHTHKEWALADLNLLPELSFKLAATVERPTRLNTDFLFRS